MIIQRHLYIEWGHLLNFFYLFILYYQIYPAGWGGAQFPGSPDSPGAIKKDGGLDAPFFVNGAKKKLKIIKIISMTSTFDQLARKSILNNRLFIIGAAHHN